MLTGENQEAEADLAERAADLIRALGRSPVADTAAVSVWTAISVVAGALSVLSMGGSLFPHALGDPSGITQLQRCYKTGWETFLANAGLLQPFATVMRKRCATPPAASKLIAPFELRTDFSRQRFYQLLLMERVPPAAALRLEHGDVEMIREHVQAESRAPGR